MYSRILWELFADPLGPLF